MPSGKLIYLVLIFIVALLFGLTNYSVVKDILFEASNYPKPEDRVERKEQKALASSKRGASLQAQSLAKDTQSASEDFIIECSDDFLESDDSYQDSVDQYLNSLADYNSMEKRLEFALFGPPPPEKSRLTLLFEFDQDFPSNPLLLMEIINLCADSGDDKCSPDFIRYALASDDQNAAMWLYAIGYFVSQNDAQDVLEAIADLEKAPIFNDRYGERILLFAQALESSNAKNFALNTVAGIGIEASRRLGYGKVATWCSSGLQDLKIAAACLNLGKTLERQSNVVIAKRLGILLQRMVYEAEVNMELFAQLKLRAEKVGQKEAQRFRKASFLLLRHEPYMRDWLKNIDSIGEIEAARVLIKEAIEFSKLEGIDHCQPQ